MIYESKVDFQVQTASKPFRNKGLDKSQNVRSLWEGFEKLFAISDI